MDETQGIPKLVDNILNKVRQYRDNSNEKKSFLKDLMNNPNSVDQKLIQDHVKESGLIVKELFDLINELDTISGNNAKPRD